MWCFFVFITTYGAYNARKSRKIRRCIENVSKKCLLLSLKWSKIWVKVEQSGEKWYKVEDRAETCGVASTFILPSLTTRLSKKRVPQTTEGSWWSLMFMGTYDHSIDAKGRVIVPAKFREELGDSFVVTLGLDGCLFVYPQEDWEDFVKQLRELPGSKEAR